MKKVKLKFTRRVIVMFLMFAFVMTNMSSGLQEVFASTKDAIISTDEGIYSESEYRKAQEVQTGQVLPDSIVISNKVAYMAPNETYCLCTTFTPKSSSDEIVWTSSNTRIATVSKLGVVTAKANGKVEITATTKNGNLTDRFKITISNDVYASTQKDINRFFNAKKATTIRIKTNEATELIIPEGRYSSKKVIVYTPKAIITNYGEFGNKQLKLVKTNQWNELAQDNTFQLVGNNSIFVGKDAKADFIINRTGANIVFDIVGQTTIIDKKKCNLSIKGNTDVNPNVTVNAKNTELHTAISLNLNLKQVITLELLSDDALKSIITADNEEVLPTLKADGSIDVQIGDKQVVVTGDPTKKQETGILPITNGGSSDNTVPSITNQDGMDKDGRAVAYFGSPDNVDGEIDNAWGKAVATVLTKYNGTTETKATIKFLWDDNAIYFLAEVKDAKLSADSGNVYERDSLEIFLDQDNKRGGTYEGDDYHFTINYKNEQSCNHGDLTSLYTATKEVPDGYVIEGRIAITAEVSNSKVMGMEAQVNDATGSARIATINLFDTSGNAFQDTSKFGELILMGKGENDVSKPNFYDLKSLVASAKEIELGRYVNGDVVSNLIVEAEQAIANSATTQEYFDDLSTRLQTAIDSLMHNTNSYDEKECRDIPKAYKMSDPESQRGTIVSVDYKTNTYDEEAKDLDKYMLVYLPNGYDENDTTKKYNVLYLIHGNVESQHTAFGGVGENTELMRVVDNLIADGKMEPMIIVTPTWYDTTPYSAERNEEDGLFRIKNFHNELTKDIIPTIESKYHVYAKSTSEADLIAAREHRAVGGFSMGSACTWYNYIYSIDYFKYYVPISLWCWQDVESIKAEGHTFTGTDDEIKAQYLAQIPKNVGYTKDDIRIFCATGTADLAYGEMNTQITEMKKLTDMFVYSADLRKGNFYYSVLPGGAHNWTCVDRYLYNILPDLFRSYWTDDYGLIDKDQPTATATATATFGSPDIDGKVDLIWSEARPIIPKYSYTPENTKATFCAMWDDNALYVLAKVKDDNVTKLSVNPYEHDSLEIFLDQNNDKSVEYGVDDLQFRINYDNDISADKGDAMRLYSATSVVDGGYVIEARIEWDDIIPKNDDTFGIELMINDGKDLSRVGTINVFDGTNNAWQNTALFGNVMLKGKTADSVTKVNPYKLLSLIRSTEEVDQSEYSNYSIVTAAINKANEGLNDPNVTQDQINQWYTELETAIKGLTYTEEAKKIKRFTPMPTEYKAPVTSVTGSSVVELFTYEKEIESSDGKKTITKNYNVYVPSSYDPEDTSKKYNVFYLMHGGGENENTIFGGPGQELELKRILDNMIARGDMEPMIVVTPTFYGEQGNIESFYQELCNNIIPQVETHYNTYYDNNTQSTQEAMKNSREHRAFGGFSMGGACTWYIFTNCLDYIKYYVPLSGNCWALSGTASSDVSADTAAYLSDIVKNSEYNSKDGFKLYCATGSDDIAYPNMYPQLKEMEKLTDTFIFDQDVTKGNTYFMVAKGGTHAWNFMNQYLYIIMPDLFK